MKQEHDRKKLSDEEKFQSLLEQKQEAIEQFDETMSKLELDQKLLLDQMTAEHATELQEARELVSNLRNQEKEEQSKIIIQREEAENQAWKDYNSINDNNRNILTENIKKGLLNKAELTKFMTDLKA